MYINKKEFVVNAIWKILESFSVKGISMVVTIILIRMMSPSDFGLLALTAIFTNLSEILIDGGFSTALIRKEKIDDCDYYAAFSISLSISIILYIILFLSAPTISDYYSAPQLTAVLRVIGLTFFIQSFAVVRNGIIIRNMQFKLLFVCNTMASLVSGVLGVALAHMGMGVWALVAQRITQQTIVTSMLIYKVEWKIKWRFNYTKIKEMMSFSLGVVGSSLLNYVGGNIFSIFIGKKYSVMDLGYYDKGNQLPMQLSLYTFGAMSNVLLPVLSTCQSDLDRVKYIVRKVVGMTSFLILPLMVGMALTSNEIITLLFTYKWIQAVPIMQCACLYYIATPFILINIQVFFALGRSELRFICEIVRLILTTVSLFWFGYYLDVSINCLAFIAAVIAVVMVFITYIEVKKLIKYCIYEVVCDIWKIVLCVIVSGTAVWILGQNVKAEYEVVSLGMKVVVGISIYITLSILLGVKEVQEICSIVKRKNKHV